MIIMSYKYFLMANSNIDFKYIYNNNNNLYRENKVLIRDVVTGEEI